MSVVAEVKLSGLRATEYEGLLGELDLMAVCMEHHGLSTSFDALVGVGGAGLRSHFFRPRDNPGTLDRPEEGRRDSFWSPRYAWTSLRHGNYGHTEAVAYFYGAEIKPLDLNDPLQNWKLLRYELEAGRPVIAYGLVEPGVPELIIGFRLTKAPLQQVLYVLSRARPQEVVEVDIRGRKVLQGPEAIYPNEIILVRPGQVAPWRGTDGARFADMLRWSLGHQHSDRELVYETSRFYATGLEAYAAFAEFLRDRVPEELADPIVVDAQRTPHELGRFAWAVVQHWRRARVAFASFARGAADHLEAQQEPLGDLAGGLAELRALADASQAAAEALDPVIEALRGDFAAVIVQEGVRELAARGLEDAQEAQREVARLLKGLVQGQ
jgi:hypothetical protein